MATIVRMPEVLANSSEAALQTWMVKEGDSITIGQPLAEIETEKASVEYAAEVEGTILRLLVGEGDSVVVGAPIGIIGNPGESGADIDRLLALSADDPPADTEGSEDAAPTSVTISTPATVPVSAAKGRLFASPLVRRLAKEGNLDLGSIAGSGPGGRIVRRDLAAVAKVPVANVPVANVPVANAPSVETPAPVVTTVQASAETSDYTDVPHTGMRRAIARRLTESKSTVPHFYLVADCRVDALMDLRGKVNATSDRKISINDFVVKAVAMALVRVPEANAIWTSDASRRFHGVDLAVAVSTDGGLLTPVLRRVETMGLSAVSQGMADLAERARGGKLKQHELEGGSFAISNLGMFGVDEFSAILNPPQSGILAVGAIKQRAIVEGGAVVAGNVMTVTLSADHRVIDGALGARWLAAFVGLIENPLSILL